MNIFVLIITCAIGNLGVKSLICQVGRVGGVVGRVGGVVGRGFILCDLDE